MRDDKSFKWSLCQGAWTRINRKWLIWQIPGGVCKQKKELFSLHGGSGEQTGALPEMLLKIAGTDDDEVDNAVRAMTSLFEPIMIVFLAVMVGSIVVALFLPLVSFPMQPDNFGSNGSGDH